MKRTHLKISTIAGLLCCMLLLTHHNDACAQWGTIPSYLLPRIDDPADVIFQKTAMRLQWEKEQQERFYQWEEELRGQLNDDYRDPHYYADLQLMMYDMKSDMDFQRELNSQDQSYDAYVAPQMQLDPARQTYLQLMQHSINNYRMPNWTTITINGVSSTPGLETGGGSGGRSSGHVTANQLNRQITREAKSYEAYKRNPTATSYLYWKSNQKLTQTYQKSLKR